VCACVCLLQTKLREEWTPLDLSRLCKALRSFGVTALKDGQVAKWAAFVKLLGATGTAFSEADLRLAAVVPCGLLLRVPSDAARPAQQRTATFFKDVAVGRIVLEPPAARGRDKDKEKGGNQKEKEPSAPPARVQGKEFDTLLRAVRAPAAYQRTRSQTSWLVRRRSRASRWRRTWRACSRL
jgi:hypothetical protein